MPPHCHTDFASHGSIILTLFLGALVGSVTHCSSMCGPFVIAQAAKFQIPQGKNPYKWYRSMLLPYHLGRLTTYTVLGILATLISANLVNNPALKIISPLMLIIAGVIFLTAAFAEILPKKFSYMSLSFCNIPTWIKEKFTKILPSDSLISSYILGVILGFLPCGLVYAAIIAVASIGNVFYAFFGMTAFAIGTMPALIIIGYGGKMLHNKFYSWIKPLYAILMLFNSVTLFIMAGKGF